MRTDGRGFAPRAFPWHLVIPAEMDMWTPERLPDRFAPRVPVRRGRVCPCWLGLAIGALLLGACILVPAPAPRPMGVELRLEPAVRVTPIPDVAPPPVSVASPQPSTPPPLLCLPVLPLCV